MLMNSNENGEQVTIYCGVLHIYYMHTVLYLSMTER